MTPDNHREKAERIERSLMKLNETDWEIKIEAAMLAGTHWVNYILHKTGLSTCAEDMIHASMTMVSVLRKYKLGVPEVIDQLELIEELRPLYVRGDVAGGNEAAEKALVALALIAEQARQL